MIFNMDDFNQDDEFYRKMPDAGDLGDFTNILMHLTSVLKNIDYDQPLRAGHEFMMTVFNMTGLEAAEKSEQPLNVVMSLISHIFAILLFTNNKEEYFEYFDQTVIYPMLEEGK